jgi:hypothetical protein
VFPFSHAMASAFSFVLLLLRVKTVGKILGNSSSIFHIFQSFSYYLVNMIISMKMRYGVAGIGRNTVELLYRPFSDWLGKLGNFPDSF